MQTVMFSKHLGSLSVPEMGKTIKQLGFDGVDLTVRPGGHVDPEKVATALPEAVRQLADAGLTVPMITTGIVDAGGTTPAILEAAAAQGIRELKLGYWRYTPFGSLRKQLDDARRELDHLEPLAAKHGVRLSIHSHSGNFLSAVAGNVAIILEGRDPHAIGAYIDPGHMTLEGAFQGWMQGIDLLQNSISMVAVKSFGLFPEPDAETGGTRWRHLLVPLKQGTVRWREVFGCLKQLGWNGIVSLHSEYQGKESWKDLDVPALVEQTREDLGFLRPIIHAAGYGS